MKGKVLLLMLAVSGYIFATGKTETTENMGAKPTKAVSLRLGHAHGEKGMYFKAAEKFKSLVEERTGGMVKIITYPNGQLGADRQLQEGVELGSIDMGISSSPVVTIDAYMKLLDAPYLFINRAHVTEVLDGEIGEALKRPLAERGIKHLAYLENGFRQITNNKRPIHTPEDLKGLKIRTPESAVRLKTFELFSASPTPMPFSEVFSALQQGVIDGQENPLSVIYQGALYEVQKYLALSNHVYSPAHLLINQGVFDSLQPDQQKIVEDAALETARYTRDLGQKEDERLVKVLKEKGLEVTQVDTAAFVERGRQVWPEILKSIPYSDAKNILSQIEELGKKYL